MADAGSADLADGMGWYAQRLGFGIGHRGREADVQLSGFVFQRCLSIDGGVQ